MSILNPEQQQVASHTSGNLIAAAVAGAGKTTAIISLIQERVKAGVHPSRILATTFSKKAAAEMQVRLDRSMPNSGVSIGTLHSVCLQIIRDGSPWHDWEIADETWVYFAIKNVTGFRGMKWEGCDIGRVSDYIAEKKAKLVGAPSMLVMQVLERDDEMDQFEEAYARYEDLRTSARKITFDDMIFLASRYLSTDNKARDRWASKYEWVIVDEFQDTNLAQYDVVKVIGSKCNLVVVGDDDQCQPEGTMVRLAHGVSVPIESIRAGDRVMSYDPARSGRLVGGGQGNHSGGYEVLATHRREYHGELVVVSSGGLTSKYTPEHRCVVRWDREGCEGKYALYMMRRGDRFRIGTAPMFYTRGVGNAGSFGPNARFQHEKADAFWVLDVYDSREDALRMEHFNSVRWGIPEVVFEGRESGNTFSLPQTQIDEFYSMFGPGELFDKANAMLAAFGRRMDMPFHHRGAEPQFGGREAAFVVRACNVLPHVMQVGHADRKTEIVLRSGERAGKVVGYRPTWTRVHGVARERYDGHVVSLKVSDSEMYVADGIITHNCIYEWRFAHPQNLINFEKNHNAKLVFMQRNYRCGKAIAEAANRLIAHNAHRLEKAIDPQRDEDGVVTVSVHGDMDLEANSVAEQICALRDRGVPLHEIAVLYRTTIQSQAVEEALRAHDIPYITHGGGSFYKRKEIRGLLAYLKASMDDNDDQAWTTIINTPFRYISNQLVQQIENYASTSGYNAAIIAVANRAAPRQKTALTTLASVVSRLKSLRTTREKLEYVNRATNYCGWLKEEGGSDRSGQDDRVGAVHRLISMSENFPDVEFFLDYIRRSVAMQRRSAKNTTGKVQLMTIHRSKGCEYQHVFLIGFNDNVIPHANNPSKDEERRLAYVAATRAKDGLYISSVLKFLDRDGFPSPFIDEMGLQLPEDDDDGNGNYIRKEDVA